MPQFLRVSLLLALGEERDKVAEIQRKNTPVGIPVGGGDWMDSFFKLEGLDGIMFALRLKKTIETALEEGKQQSSEAVAIWNSRREYQVHRHKETAWKYLENILMQLRKKQCQKHQKEKCEFSQTDIDRFCGPWSVQPHYVQCLIGQLQCNRELQTELRKRVQLYYAEISDLRVELEEEQPQDIDLKFWQDIVVFYRQVLETQHSPGGRKCRNTKPRN